MLAEDAWLLHLKNIDAIVNCASVLQDNERVTAVVSSNHTQASNCCGRDASE